MNSHNVIKSARSAGLTACIAILLCFVRNRAVMFYLDTFLRNCQTRNAQVSPCGRHLLQQLHRSTIILLVYQAQRDLSLPLFFLTPLPRGITSFLNIRAILYLARTLSSIVSVILDTIMNERRVVMFSIRLSSILIVYNEWSLVFDK